ncbi:hypothetical protein [Sorangium sp. So ce1078]|uniref:hypothetical protein n=1 Tax=Sorangium sp. So ce1078 TaxID=3133329 RepID=UPI003F60F0EB
MQNTLSRARLQIALFALMAAVASAGLAVEVLKPILKLKGRSGVFPLLSLSYEQNVPTWYTSCLLFACALTPSRSPSVRWSPGSRSLGAAFFTAVPAMMESHHRNISWAVIAARLNAV